MTANRSAPAVTVVPILVYQDVSAAIQWLCSAFGFVERLRVPGPDASILHAQLTVGDGALMLGCPGGEFGPPHSNQVSQYVVVQVTAVDSHFQHAREHGARILKEPADMPFGERQYTALDPWGHRWTFSQSVTDVAPESWGAKLARPSTK